jgi:hypothetical protein
MGIAVQVVCGRAFRAAQAAAQADALRDVMKILVQPAWASLVVGWKGDVNWEWDWGID